MNLIERARDRASQANRDRAWERSIADIAVELAGEVERLWAFEKNFNEVVRPAFTDQCQVMADAINEKNIEIARLKAGPSPVSLMRKWLDGYHAAASQFQPILFNLLRAADDGLLEPTEDEQ